MGANHKTHKGEYLRGCRCAKCGVYQRLSAIRRTKRRGREDICRSCELNETHRGEYRHECRCTKCGVYQRLSAFRWTKRREREDICRSCELVPCEACAAMLPSGNFAQWDMYRYFSSAGAEHITCLLCKEQRHHARQQRLQELMKKRERK